MKHTVEIDTRTRVTVDLHSGSLEDAMEYITRHHNVGNQFAFLNGGELSFHTGPACEDVMGWCVV